MSESDVWPKYKVVYDNCDCEYIVKYYYINGGKEYTLGRHPWKWVAVMEAKRAIKRDEKERNRTNEVVWGPYP